MTKPLGIGTVNTALNMTREERQLWGRAAFQHDASLNQFFQECALAKLKEIQPTLAEEIERARKARGMVIHLARTTAIIFLAGAMLFLGESPQRRGSRVVRTSRPVFARKVEST